MTTTQTRDRFSTRADARTALTGTDGWEWGGESSWEGWASYAYRHAVETRDDTGDWQWDHDACLRAYLVSVGEEPSEYGLTPSGTRPLADLIRREYRAMRRSEYGL